MITFIAATAPAKFLDVGARSPAGASGPGQHDVLAGPSARGKSWPAGPRLHRCAAPSPDLASVAEELERCCTDLVGGGLENVVALSCHEGGARGATGTTRYGPGSKPAAPKHCDKIASAAFRHGSRQSPRRVGPFTGQSLSQQA